MYKILATITLILSITVVLSAQDVQESNQKKVTIGIDALPLIGGFANAQLGFLHNNGKTEAVIAGFTGQDPDETWVLLAFGRHIDYIQSLGILKGIFLVRPDLV